jgi:putative ABC transport system substrate-binding protein
MRLRLTVTRFAAAVAILLVAAPLAAEMQQLRKIGRLGVLAGQSPESSPPAYALRQGLSDLGYVEGRNIVIEWRWARGRVERFSELAAELVKLEVDVIVAENNPAIAAAQKATRTVPIVMVIPTDPVGLGFVASLARPGGNTTGLSSQGRDTGGKRLELLKEAVSNLAKVAILWDPTEPGRRDQVKEVETAALGSGVKVQLVEARSPSELDGAFATIAREGAGAVYVQGSTITLTHRARIAELAARRRLPTMCGLKEFVEAGCLLSYNVSFRDQFRRAAYFVDKILKGTKPADLPVEQPTKFELIINARTAKLLGLTIPPSILLRTDQVIE